MNLTHPIAQKLSGKKWKGPGCKLKAICYFRWLFRCCSCSLLVLEEYKSKGPPGDEGVHVMPQPQ